MRRHGDERPGSEPPRFLRGRGVLHRERVRRAEDPAREGPADRPALVVDEVVTQQDPRRFRLVREAREKEPRVRREKARPPRHEHGRRRGRGDLVRGAPEAPRREAREERLTSSPRERPSPRFAAGRGTAGTSSGTSRRGGSPSAVRPARAGPSVGDAPERRHGPASTGREPCAREPVGLEVLARAVQRDGDRVRRRAA
jgi:hypothetical protein